MKFAQLFNGMAVGTAIVAVATLAGSGVALADGMERGRVSYEKPYSWSGVYVGLNAGVMSSEIEGNFAPLNPAFSFDANPTSGIFGLHLGLQHQIGSFVFGIEGGLSSAFGSDDGTKIGGGIAGACGFVAVTQSCEGGIDSIRSIGGRLGYASERWLVYGSGGFAQARINTWGVTNATGVKFSEGTNTHDGWYAGAGVEFAIGRYASLGIDYKHYEFDAEAHTATTATDSRVVSANADAVTARLTFRFGRDEAVPLK